MRVAGLPLLKRTWRILSRAGIERVTLVGDSDGAPFSEWASESGLDPESVQSWQADGCPALLFPADLAFQHDFFQHFLKGWSRAENSARTLAAEGEQDRCVVVGQGLKGRFASFEDVQGAIEESAGRLDLQAIEVASACRRISGKESARLFHRRIERTMIKQTDGLFACWNRKVSIPLTRLLALLPITPNMVTYLTLAVSIGGAYLLSRGSYLEMLIGALITQLASILDGNDGELARLRILDSDYGTWLDTICDYISYFFTFGGITYGMYNRTGNTGYVIAGGVMFAGIFTAMALISRLRRKYTGEAGAAALSSMVDESLSQNRDKSFIAKLGYHLRHFGTRATFSYFLIVFALLDGWTVLLGIVTVGAQLYWLAIIYNQKFLKGRAAA